MKKEMENSISQKERKKEKVMKNHHPKEEKIKGKCSLREMKTVFVSSSSKEQEGYLKKGMKTE